MATVNNKYRISKPVGFILIACALVIDVIELVLALTGVGEAVNYVLDVVKIVAIPIIFGFLEVPIFSKGIGGKLATTILVGLIPFVGSFLPELTIGIWRTVRHAQKEDQKNIDAGMGVQHGGLGSRLKGAATTGVTSKASLKKTRTARSTTKTPARSDNPNVTRTARSKQEMPTSNLRDAA